MDIGGDYSRPCKGAVFIIAVRYIPEGVILSACRLPSAVPSREMARQGPPLGTVLADAGHLVKTRSYRRSRVAVPTPSPVPSPGPPPVWVIQSCCAPGPTYMLKLGPSVTDSVPVQSAATV